jgi:hydrogenase nickel incorporation protein HypA/HybF
MSGRPPAHTPKSDTFYRKFQQSHYLLTIKLYNTPVHELSVTENILEIALRHASRANASRVTKVYLIIGRLSSIVDDSVQFYWDMISKGTLCAGASLHFERIPARLACENCGTSYTLVRELMACPSCGGVEVRVLSGDEFRVASIEIDTTFEG